MTTLPIRARAGALSALVFFISACGGGGGGGDGGSGPPPPAAAPAPTVTLSASSASIPSGGTTTLTWSSTNATSCTASGGWTGSKAPSGTETTAALTAATSFTLTCTGAGGTAQQSVNVAVAGPAPAPTAMLSASATTVPTSRAITLTYSSTNATSCEASEGWTGNVGISGTYMVTPTTTTRYVLTCTGAGGVIATFVTVGVGSPTTISGTIVVPNTSQADGDTNDTTVPPVRNNSAATAQTLPNPVVLGGYVNVPGAGETGPLQAGGDEFDVYRINALAGQVIELTVTNDSPSTNDADLELFNSAGTLINTSNGVGRLERLMIPANGTYFVRVVAYSGATNYTLAVGEIGTLAVTDAPTLGNDFMPGEALVQLSGTTEVSDTVRTAMATQWDLEIGESTVPGLGRLVVRFSTNTTLRVQAMAASAAADRAPAADERVFGSDHDRQKYETLMAIKRLGADPRVKYAVPNYVVRTHRVPNDPFYARQRWHYEQINLPQAWDIATGSSSVIVAVIDSGVRPHTELGPKLVPGWDFVPAFISGDGDGPDGDASDPGMDKGTGQLIFHGTHVAGTVGAFTNEGTGVAGVAWGVRIMPLRVIGVNDTGFDIGEAIRFAAGLPNASGRLPQQKADIINMSLGYDGPCDAYLRDAITAARNAGVIIIASAGNKSLPRAGAPSNCEGVISVAATNARRERADYSNYGTDVDVAAPGGDGNDYTGDGYSDAVFSTYSRWDGTVYTSTATGLVGTSMASPHVAGVVALMKSVNSSLTAAQVDSFLANRSIVDDLPTNTSGQLGAGLINANKAVRAAQGNPAARPAQLGANPTSLSYGLTETQAEVVVANVGDGAVGVAGTATSAAYISVTPVAVTGGLGRYRISVNRAGLAANVYNGWVEFRGSTGTPVRVGVLFQVGGGAAAVTPDSGYHYVLLLDEATYDTVAQVDLATRSASVPYTFTNVQPGRYFVVGGTDMNNDGFICDDGEACAEWPVYGRETVIVVAAPTTGITLPTGFRSNPTTAAQSAPGDAEVTGSRRGYRRLR